MSAEDLAGERPQLASKRVLVTHSLIDNIMGSTVVALDLARWLTAHGASVVIYAAYAQGPLLDEFTAVGVEVVTDGAAGVLDARNFDLVWVHSQVLPERFIETLPVIGPGGWPQIVFHHMSALPQIAADEFAYIPDLEERVATVSSFVSRESLDAQRGHFRQVPPTVLYPNPCPAEFCQVTPREPRSQLSSVLIVSNHPTEVLDEVASLLAARGIEVRRFGDGRDEYRLVRPEDIASHDAVVSIGKTVQYCLVSGVPVYVYDHFGGYGYLDHANVDVARRNNFSGRGGQQLTAESIVEDLIDRYGEAVEFAQLNRQQFVDEFSIDVVLPRVLAAAAQARHRDPVDGAYLAAVLSAQRVAARNFRSWGELAQARRESLEARARMHDCEQLAADQQRLAADALRRAQEAEQRADAAEQDLVELREGFGHEQQRADTELGAARDEIVALRNSWTWRLGRVVVGPVAPLKRAFVRFSDGWR